MNLKSIAEQVFSQTYANVCKVLSKIKVSSNDDPKKNVNFRTMLLTKCQKEFDTRYYQDVSYDKLLLEVETCQDEIKRQEMKVLANEKLLKTKRRLGSIRFIGELYKLGMLTEGIMNDCIERLLKQDTDEENLECLCRLMTTIGKDIDKPNSIQTRKMKSYFDRLEKIVEKKDCVSARIQFMILNVIDLKKNQWVPARKDSAPTVNEEIRKEAEEEQTRIARNQQNDRPMEPGGHSGQKGGSGQRDGLGVNYFQSLKSSSVDSEAFREKRQNIISISKKIMDVVSV